MESMTIRIIMDCDDVVYLVYQDGEKGKGEKKGKKEKGKKEKKHVQIKVSMLY